MIILGKNLPLSPASPINSIDEALECISILEKELSNSSISGVGLAMPQLGINKAAAICRIPDKNGNINKIDLVNPKFIDGDDLIIFEEGCLSFPGESCKTIRFNQVMLETLDFYIPNNTDINKRRNIVLQGLPAIVSQHESAHLMALNMYDFVPKEVGRNDMCPIHKEKKNKKCCNIKYYNDNLNKILKMSF